MKRTLVGASIALWAATAAAQSGPQLYIPITPCRMVDTRTDSSGGPITSAAVRNLTLTGPAYSGIPAASNPCTVSTAVPTTAIAVLANFTMVNVSGPADLRVAPWGTAPTNSVANSAGNTVANGIAELLASNGSGGLGISVKSGGATFNLIVDLVGYFTKNAAGSGSGSLLSVQNLGTGGAFYGVAAGTGHAIEGFSNDGHGIHGSSATGTAIYGTTDASTNVAGVSGHGDSGAFGVFGQTSDNHGVHGRATSLGATDSAGVFGVDGSGRSGETGNLSAGVRGESVTGIAVFGSTTDAAGSGIGVAADEIDSITGDSSAAAYLAFNGWGGQFSSLTVSGTKSFIEPHPTDPTKEIIFVSLEGPESGTYFRGSASIVNGFATIAVPEAFRLVTDPDGLTFVATPVGDFASIAVVSQDLDRIVVKGSADVKFHYIVNGVRKAFRDHQPIVANRDFVPFGPTDRHFTIYAAELQRRLVATGIYNADGTPNVETARRLGWQNRLGWRASAEK